MRDNLVLKILIHACGAAVIFFAFQRYALGSTLETSALWAAAGAIGAGALAWSQHRRSS